MVARRPESGGCETCELPVSVASGVARSGDPESQGYAVTSGSFVAAGISSTAGDDAFGIVRHHSG